MRRRRSGRRSNYINAEKCSHFMHSIVFFHITSMASRLVVALACFALCHSSPVLLNGYLYRDGRSYSIGQAYGGNHAVGSATINGDVVQAYGSATNDNQYARNGYGEAYPGQLVAQAQAYDTPNAPYGGANAVAEARDTPTYYAVPLPQAIVSYKQNFAAPPHSTYEYQPIAPGAIAAESNAVVNGNSESSVTSVRSDGSGIAESSAQTNGVGNFGITSSNAKTIGSGFGSASSNANNAYDSASTVAKTQGSGIASSQSRTDMGLTSANTQTNGGFGSASSTINHEAAIASANTQGFGAASSNANLNAANFAKKAIHSKGWHFGLAYDRSGSVHANTQSGAGVAKSTAQANGIGHGVVHSSADAQGSGVANANADINAAGYIRSTANSHNYGYGLTKASGINNYGSANSDANVNGYGAIKSTANTHGSGYANANADVNNAGAVQANANTNGNGSAASTVNAAPTFGAFKTYVPYGGHSAVNAHSTGSGSANSFSRTHETGAKVVNSSANSNGYGTAQANAQSY